MRRPHLVLATLCFSLGVHAWADTAADLRAMVEAGRRTESRWTGSGSTWRTVFDQGNGVSVIFTMTRVPDKQQMVVTLERGAERHVVMRMVIRDGFWYVQDEKTSVKYRPFEYPAVVQPFYFWFSRSSPQVVDDEVLKRVGPPTAVDDHTVTFKMPFPPATVEQLTKFHADATAILDRSPNMAGAEKLRQQMAEIDAKLKAGVVVRADRASGLVLEDGIFPMHVEVRDFKLLDKVPDSEFAVDGRTWRDDATDPTTGDVNELVMMDHCPAYQPGDKNHESDTRLVNVTNGHFRRVAFHGPQCFPVAFLPGRKAVIVDGLDITGVLRPYRIDLVTGENRPLGGARFDTGMAFGGSISPDGKQLVMLRRSATGGMFSGETCIIELATNESRVISSGLDLGFAKWLDNDRLVFTQRHEKGVDQLPDTNIAILKLDGAIKPLCRGRVPIPLADAKTILFQDEKKLWNTCDANGENVRLVADGLNGYEDAAPAPDGKRLLMLQVKPRQSSRPMLLNLGEGQGREITPAPGLWGMPVWK